VPVEQAFSVFENPNNLLDVTPPWLNLRVTNPQPVTMRAGAEIQHELRWLGLPLRWTSRITVYEPPVRFVDEQIRGPYAFWRHQHTFEAIDGGTLVGDCVDYALPLRLCGSLAHALVVGRQLRRIFTFRQDAMARLIGAPVEVRRAPRTQRFFSVTLNPPPSM
jgi:ligand-binding SRPBCC domain-containing protein